MNIEEIIERFYAIREMEFVESTRPNNKDGGIGNTLEDLLQIRENNLTEADFHGYEIKSQRELTSSYLSLFSKSPDYPRGANAILKDKFGEIRDESPHKKLDASLIGGRESIIYEKYNMKLEIDRDNNKLRLSAMTIATNTIYNEVYWTFETLRRSSHKLNNLIFAQADTRKIDNKQHFHYKKIHIYSSFNFDAFINAIEQGLIQFDIRIGAYNSGRNIGKAHDHGSGFRIRPSNLNVLYDDYRII